MSDYTYFASDFHLGLNQGLSSAERERHIINWLDSIKSDCSELYLLGDVFDFWYEYRKVVPRGHVRLLAKLAEYTDSGIPVHIFTGNHDMWMFGYLEEEIGVKLYKSPIEKQIGNKMFFLGHGDGLGPGDHGYKFIKKVFANRINQWLFAVIHPNLGIKLMQLSSKKSRESEMEAPEFLGPDKEWLIQFCEKKIKDSDIDYFIFGHRHLPIEHTLSNGRSIYINTGDWIKHFSFARFDGHAIELLKFDK